MPKKEKPKVIMLRDEADEKWSKVVLARAKYKCEVCGSKEVVQAHHFFPKNSFPVLRYDVENGVALCRSCHFKHHFREDPYIVCKIIQKRTQKWCKQLYQKTQKSKKLKQNSEYYENVIEKMVKKFKKIIKKRK